ncbi:MAG TPA: SDR family oxidoreductase [Myxococcales bacterium]|nr:SDR family oxidoreductase [Myxococcales bacterium]HIK86325.1 SDR family oxidoreductase [Myxococcales bacterium]
MGSLEGKVAVIAGGSGGFGEGTVKRFRDEGATVWIASRDEARGKESAERLGARHQPCDITRSEDVKALADVVLAESGRIDIAVNSAGYEDNCPVADLEAERVERMVAVQFTGALYFIQHMANAMKQGGSIITIGSLTATLTADGYAPYAGAKAGINHASRIAAAEYGPKGIRINVVSATLVETPMTAALINAPGVRKAFVAETPLGRFGSIDDIVNAIYWLASDQSSFVTGQDLLIDGGASLRRLPRVEDFIRSAQEEMAE